MGCNNRRNLHAGSNCDVRWPSFGRDFVAKSVDLAKRRVGPIHVVAAMRAPAVHFVGGAIDSWLAAGAVAAAADPAPGVGAALAAGAGEVVSAGSAMAEGDAALHHAKSPILLWHVHVDGQAGKFDWD